MDHVRAQLAPFAVTFGTRRPFLRASGPTTSILGLCSCMGAVAQIHDQQMGGGGGGGLLGEPGLNLSEF